MSKWFFHWINQLSFFSYKFLKYKFWKVESKYDCIKSYETFQSFIYYTFNIFKLNDFIKIYTYEHTPHRQSFEPSINI